MNIQAILNPEEVGGGISSASRKKRIVKPSDPQTSVVHTRPHKRLRRSARHQVSKHIPREEKETLTRGRQHSPKDASASNAQKRRPKGSSSGSGSNKSSSGISPARLLLSKARRTIADQEQDPENNPHGRKPFIMDVILDSLPPTTEFREDILMEALERSERCVLPVPQWSYTFKDTASLDAYWADQGAIWRAIGGNWIATDTESESRPATQSRVSAERSTVLWNCHLDRPWDSESDFVDDNDNE